MSAFATTLPSWRRARWGAIGLVAALIVAVLGVSGALGATPITSGPAAVAHDAFVTATYTIDQGQKATFANYDTDLHNVTAVAKRSRREPLFRSANTDTNKRSVVNGTQYLKSGRYAFICTIHSFMKATLVVSRAGKPLVRPKTKRHVAKHRRAQTCKRKGCRH